MLYLFYGADTYLVKETYTELFLKIAPKGSKIEDYILDGDDSSADQALIEAFSTSSLFSDISLVILKDFANNYNKWGKTEQKKLKEYLEKTDIAKSKTKNLIWIEGDLKAKDIDNPLGHFVKASGIVKHIEKLKGIDFKKWLLKQTKEKDVSLDPEALAALVSAFEGETNLL
ncbi:MAG: hypothetical protein WAW33_00625, partial [Minisyncoccia bacterium]